MEENQIESVKPVKKTGHYLELEEIAEVERKSSGCSKHGCLYELHSAVQALTGVSFSITRVQNRRNCFSLQSMR